MLSNFTSTFCRKVSKGWAYLISQKKNYLYNVVFDQVADRISPIITQNANLIQRLHIKNAFYKNKNKICTEKYFKYYSGIAKICLIYFAQKGWHLIGIQGRYGI